MSELTQQIDNKIEDLQSEVKRLEAARRLAENIDCNIKKGRDCANTHKARKGDADAIIYWIGQLVHAVTAAGQDRAVVRVLHNDEISWPYGWDENDLPTKFEHEWLDEKTKALWDKLTAAGCKVVLEQCRSISDADVPQEICYQIVIEL